MEISDKGVNFKIRFIHVETDARKRLNTGPEKIHTFHPIMLIIQAILPISPTHELVIYAMFHNDWFKIVILKN